MTSFEGLWKWHCLNLSKKCLRLRPAPSKCLSERRNLIISRIPRWISKINFFLGFLIIHSNAGWHWFNLDIWYRLKGKNIGEVTKKLKDQLHLQPPEFRPYMRQHLFPLKNNSFLDARDDLLSFVFVREPFERLVSSYYDKMDRDWSKPVYDLRWMRDEIIHK